MQTANRRRRQHIGTLAPFVCHDNCDDDTLPRKTTRRDQRNESILNPGSHSTISNHCSGRTSNNLHNNSFQLLELRTVACCGYSPGGRGGGGAGGHAAMNDLPRNNRKGKADLLFFSQSNQLSQPFAVWEGKGGGIIGDTTVFTSCVRATITY